MTHYSSVMSAIKTFIDKDMIPAATGNQRIILRMASAAVAASPEAMFNKAANSQMVQAFGVVDGEMVNIDALAELLTAGLADGEFEFGFRLLGTDYKFFVNANDIRKIKMYCGG